MTKLAFIFASFSPSVLFVFAGLLAWTGKEGWGWFLFVGILLAGGTPIKVGDKA